MGDLLKLDRKIGIQATDDIDALLALRPDCIVYMPLHPDVEEMTRLLRPGIVTYADLPPVTSVLRPKLSL